MKNNKLVVFAIIVVIAAVVSFSAGHFLTKNGNFPSTNTAMVDSKAQAQTSPAPANSENPFTPGAFATGDPDSHLTTAESVLNIFIRLLLAVILSAMLAFRALGFGNFPLFVRFGSALDFGIQRIRTGFPFNGTDRQNEKYRAYAAGFKESFCEKPSGNGGARLNAAGRKNSGRMHYVLYESASEHQHRSSERSDFTCGRGKY
jgi:hypothetical protein